MLSGLTPAAAHIARKPASGVATVPKRSFASIAGVIEVCLSKPLERLADVITSAPAIFAKRSGRFRRAGVSRLDVGPESTHCGPACPL